MEEPLLRVAVNFRRSSSIALHEKHDHRGVAFFQRDKHEDRKLRDCVLAFLTDDTLRAKGDSPGIHPRQYYGKTYSY